MLVSFCLLAFAFCKKILDIDECTNQESHECGSTGICQNTKGSYICHCGQGYKTLPGVHNACYGKLGWLEGPKSWHNRTCTRQMYHDVASHQMKAVPIIHQIAEWVQSS